MKSWKKLILRYVIVFVIFTALAVLCNRFNIISIPESEKLIDTQFDILTVNSVFAGFSFTVLGLIISLSDTTMLIALRETPFLRKYCSIVTESIFDFIISVVISLYFIFGLNNWLEGLSKKETLLLTLNGPYIIELLFLLKGIIFFVISVIKLIKILNKNFLDNEKKGNDKIKKFDEAMKKQK